ncbi:MAG: S49 family peptidase [Rhizobiales bacterium 64-17]|nr:MAG: S49 family peptidase [Rhizobiales bacterium 64-17]
MRDTLKNLIPARWRRDGAVVPVVRLQGVIGFSTPLRPGMTLASVARPLDRAFAVKGAKAVALSINSPGGSPAQSHLICRRIRQLAAEKNLPVIAFIEDVAASGGYMIACAADEIIGDTYSIAGSIGVVGGSFGFHKLIEKVGIERRLYTSGEHKAMLDPFLPEKPDDVERIKAVQREIHHHFIALVKERRAGKLKGDDAELFSGEYWMAERAQELGLVDSIGDLRGVLRARYGDKVKTPLIVEKKGLLGRLVPSVSRDALGALAGMPDEWVSSLEARALWSRYGF